MRQLRLLGQTKTQRLPFDRKAELAQDPQRAEVIGKTASRYNRSGGEAKGVVEHNPGRFRAKAMSPERAAQPVAELEGSSICIGRKTSHACDLARGGALDGPDQLVRHNLFQKEHGIFQRVRVRQPGEPSCNFPVVCKCCNRAGGLLARGPQNEPPRGQNRALRHVQHQGSTSHTVNAERGRVCGAPQKTHPRFLGTPVPPLQEPPASCRFAASVWGTACSYAIVLPPPAWGCFRSATIVQLPVMSAQ